MYSQPMGRIENGAAAAYEFSISDLFKEAWARIAGFKATAWGGFIALIIAYTVATAIIKVLAGSPPGPSPLRSALELLRTLILYPLLIGYLLLGIKQAAGLPVRAGMVFDYYSHIINITAVFIFETVIILAPIVLAFIVWIAVGRSNSSLVLLVVNLATMALALSSIYFMYAYVFAIQLAVEKKLGIWASLEISRKAVTQHWFKIFFTYMLTLIIVFVSALPFLIGLIWSIPFSLTLNGVLYRTLFGVEQASA